MPDLTSTGPLRIGTRGSRLALWQAKAVRDALLRSHPRTSFEIVVIQTRGDRDRSTPLAQFGGTGVFTKELESALQLRQCDVAVHSLKDLPTALAEGFVLGAVLERADPRDAWIARDGQTLTDLPADSLVGTSSLRRRSQLLALRPDLRVCNLRGNVPTRLRAVGVDLDEGKAPSSAEPIAATLLACAGLHRLGLAQHITQALAPERFVPAPAQGIVAIEARTDDARTLAILAAIDHKETRALALAERGLLHKLEGGCRVPIGALATPVDGEYELSAYVGDDAGQQTLRGQLRGADPARLGHVLAEQLLARGAAEIVQRARDTQQRGE